MPPLTHAERQKRYREKLKATNPEKLREQKKRNSERTSEQYKNKKAGFSEEQKEDLRKKWRENEKKKSIAPGISQNSATGKTKENTTDTKTIKQNQVARKHEKQIVTLKNQINVMMKGYISLNKRVQTQQKQIEDMNKKYENIIKKLGANTETKTNNEVEIGIHKNITATDETPIKRAAEFINQTIPNIETPKKEEIKRKLIEHNLLQDSFKIEYKNSNQTERNVLKRIVNSEILKKYKQTTKFKLTLGLQKSSYKTVGEHQNKRTQLKQQIPAFYKRDDVSRATAGKKEYKTHKKVKYQKRYLLDTLKNLHKKYIEEIGPVSFSTFKKYRPIYVVSPNIKDCESCACVKHCNMQFMIDSLKSFGLLKSNILNDVVSGLVCDLKSKRCMYDDCSDCSGRRIDNGETDINIQVKWFKWSLQEYEYGKEGNVKKAKKMMKTEKEGTLKDLLETFNREMTTFKKHVFNVYYQYKQYKQCQNNLQEHEALIHIDFSENYVLKYHQEVQATHFVKDQITLHTGVLYLKNQEPKSFCSISPDNTHNPESIWGHLDPILNYVKNEHPNISTIHFFSDGPATQYRQKKNFFLFSQKIYEYGFTNSSWSFFEAAHGKGAADGVGGAVKRTLDMKTAQGLDIPDAKTAYNALVSTDTKIKIFYVPAELIKPMEPLIVENLTAIAGTMKIHQLITCEKYKIKYRGLSCFCKDISEACECHSPKHHDFSTLNTINKTKQNRKRNHSNENIKISEQKSLKNIKRPRNVSISTSEDDTDIEIEYAESDADDEFLSDVSVISDSFEKEEPAKDLNEKSGKNPKNIDPNKRISILSSIIIKQANQNSKTSKFQDLNQEQKTRKHQQLVINGDKENFDEKETSSKMMKDAEKINKTEVIYTDDNINTEIQDSCELKKKQEKETATLDTCESKNQDEEEGNGSVSSNSCRVKKDETLENNKTETFCKDSENRALFEDEDNKDKRTDITNDCREKKDENNKTEELEKHCEYKTESLNDLENKAETFNKDKETKTESSRNNEDKKAATIDEIEAEIEKNEDIYDVGNSVIIRYYERKKWKYYVGFITDIINKNNDTFYKIQFLKTMTNPTLKFMVTRKIESDIVPSILVVKRINLVLELEKQYILKDYFDDVYFI